MQLLDPMRVDTAETYLQYLSDRFTPALAPTIFGKNHTHTHTHTLNKKHLIHIFVSISFFFFYVVVLIY